MTGPRAAYSALLIILLASAAAWLAPSRASADVATDVNKIRALGCSGHSGVRAALVENPRLDIVAQQLERGIPLRLAQKNAGYHATSSASVQITGVIGNANVQRVLEQQFCTAASNPDYREMGVYRRGSNVWIVLAQPFTPPRAADSARISRRVLELTNEARSRPRRCGGVSFSAAPPLSLNPELETAAEEQAYDMAVNNYMSHTGTDGSNPATRVTRTGYQWRLVGENLAVGVMTPEETVQGWLESPHHCENIMDPRFREMGVAFRVNASNDAGVFWAEEFGTPK